MFPGALVMVAHWRRSQCSAACAACPFHQDHKSLLGIATTSDAWNNYQSTEI